MGEVTGLVRRGSDGRVAGVEVDGETIEGDAVVIAMGPWSILATRWLPLPPVFGLKGHSLVFETGAKVPAEALFLEYQEAGRAGALARGVPARRRHHLCLRHLQREPAAGRSRGRDARPRRHRAAARHVQPAVAGARPAKVIARQACYRPVTRDGLPLIGPVAGVEGAYRRHRPQRLGHAQRAGDRRGDGRADPRRCGTRASTLRPSIQVGCDRAGCNGPRPDRGRIAPMCWLDREGPTAQCAALVAPYIAAVR